MSDADKYLTCSCNHCSQRLEYPADALGKEINCPNCGLVTRLYSIQEGPSLPVPPQIRPASKDLVPRRSVTQAPAPAPFAAAATAPIVSGAWSRFKGKAGRASKLPSKIQMGGLALAILIVCGVIAAILTRKTTVSGQVFIVTRGGDNIKLGAVEIFLIDKKQVTGFLHARQTAIDNEIAIRKKELADALRNVDAAKARVADAKSEYDRAMAGVRARGDYVQIKAQKDALSQTNAFFLNKMEPLRRQLVSLGVSDEETYLSDDPDTRNYQLGIIGEHVDLRRAKPLLIQLNAISKALEVETKRQIERLGLSEILPDEQLARKLQDIEQHVAAEEEPKVAATEEALTAAQLQAAKLEDDLNHFPAGADYLSGLLASVSVTQRTLTDADGKFSMTCPRGKAFTLFATAERAVIDNTETYFWLIDAPASSVQVFLSNNNLAEVDPDSYFKLKP